MLSIPVIMGFAFLTEACFGFGGAVIAIPLLTLSMPPKDAVFLMLIFQCLKAALLIPAWKHISWKALNLLPLGLFLGVLIGINVLDIVSPKLFRLGLAVYLLGFVISEYINFKTVSRTWLDGKAGSMTAGLLGGVISGITGMGGPPYVIYLRALGLDKLAFRATIILIVSLSNFLRLFLDAHEIVQNETVLSNLLPCLAVFTLVSIIGSHLPKVLSEKVFKTAINLMLLSSSLMLFYKSFT